METTLTATLQPRTIERLNDVLIYLHDSEKVYKECANVIKTEKLKPFLCSEAEARLSMIGNIEEYIFDYGDGETPTQRGSLTAPFHRIFLDIKALLTGGDAEKILDEIKKSEKTLTTAYHEALDCELPDELHKVLKKHLTHIENKISELNTLDMAELDTAELAIDEANELSFPASDPPVFTEAKTKIKAKTKAEPKAEPKAKKK